MGQLEARERDVRSGGMRSLDGNVQYDGERSGGVYIGIWIYGRYNARGGFGHSARWGANKNLNGNPLLQVKLRKWEQILDHSGLYEGYGGYNETGVYCLVDTRSEVSLISYQLQVVYIYKVSYMNRNYKETHQYIDMYILKAIHTINYLKNVVFKYTHWIYFD